MYGGFARRTGLQPHDAVLLRCLQREPRDVRMTQSEQRLALALAGALSRAWEPGGTVPVRQLPAEAERWVQRLIDGGVGGLAWWRLRETELGPGAEARTAQGSVPASRAHCRATGTRPPAPAGPLQRGGDRTHPLQGVGSLARLYPHRALRPFGDFDLLVREDEAERARTVLRSLGPDLQSRADVDTATTLARYLPDRTEVELFGRARPESLDGARFRTLAPEDHLRLVTLHQLHHGSWRPLWLVDVAILVESLPADFSWSLCLAGDSHLSEGVLVCIALAQELLKRGRRRGPLRSRCQPGSAARSSTAGCTGTRAGPRRSTSSASSAGRAR